MATSEITNKLSEISEIMADGYYFIHLRTMMEDMETKSDEAGAKNY